MSGPATPSLPRTHRDNSKTRPAPQRLRPCHLRRRHR